MTYDTFVGTSATGANTFEVMVWLGLYGGVSPLSANRYPFTPIATPTIGGVVFDLAYGLNGAVKVYSFVAHSHAATSFSGDLVCVLRDLIRPSGHELTADIVELYKSLETNYASNGFTSSLYLQEIQAGSEVFEGSNAKLATSAYSIVVT